jgi:hypothetical protein
MIASGSKPGQRRPATRDFHPPSGYPKNAEIFEICTANLPGAAMGDQCQASFFIII